MTLLRITSPYFVAGVIVGERAAPILRYMARWSEAKIRDYCRRKRWPVEELVEGGGRMSEDDWPILKPKPVGSYVAMSHDAYEQMMADLDLVRSDLATLKAAARELLRSAKGSVDLDGSWNPDRYRAAWDALEALVEEEG